MSATSLPDTVPASAPAPVRDVPAPAHAPSARTLTTADRCDVCGAQAYVKVVLAGGELCFCGHHARAQGEPLRAAALLYQDETSRLLAG